MKKQYKAMVMALSLGVSGSVLAANNTVADLGTANADNSVAIGSGATTSAKGTDGVALGFNASVAAASGVALGTGSSVITANGVAIGSGAKVSIADGVAIGSGSVATVNKGKLGYAVGTTLTDEEKASATWTSTLAAVSVGVSSNIGVATSTRQITGVAAGLRDTDAVNVAQLKKLQSTVDANKINYVSINTNLKSSTSNINNDGATGTDTIAIGPLASAAGNYAMAVGRSANASGANATALGAATASGSSALAAGNKATSSAIATVAVGSSTVASANYGTALGASAEASGTEATALGYSASASGMDSVALGKSAAASADDAIAVGNTSKAQAKYSVAVGRNAIASAEGTIAVGISSAATGSGAVAVGRGSKASNLGAAYGYNSEANILSAALGPVAKATGTNAVAVGPYSKATNLYSIALGYQSSSDAETSMALGYYSKAEANNATAIGSKAEANGKVSLAIGDQAYVGAETTGSSGSGNVGTSGNRISSVSEERMTNPLESEKYNYSIALGGDAKAFGYQDTAIGSGAEAYDTNTLAVGFLAKAKGHYAEAIGTMASADGKYAAAIGNNASATAESAVALGYNTQATEATGVALGSKSVTNVAKGSIGYDPLGSYTTEAAILGSNASQYSTLTNEITTATAEVTSLSNEVIALQNELNTATDERKAEINEEIKTKEATLATKKADLASKQAEADSLISVWQATAAGVSVGNSATGLTRQINNVAAGTLDTDAVNVAQLKRAVEASKISLVAGTGIVIEQKDGVYTISANIKGTNSDTDTITVKPSNPTYADTASEANTANNGGTTNDTANSGATTTSDGTATGSDANSAATGSSTSNTGSAISDSNASNGTTVSKGEQIEVSVDTKPIAVGADEGAGALKAGSGLSIIGDSNIKTTASEITNADGTKTTQVKLTFNNELNGFDQINTKEIVSDSVSAGNTTITNDGLTIKGTDGAKNITIQNNNVSLGGNVIHDVADGVAPTDAVNKGQLDTVANQVDVVSNQVDVVSNQVNNLTTGVGQMNNRLNDMDNRIDRVGAGAAALASLHPLEYDAAAKWEVSAGVGNYKGANAVAVGAFYRPNGDTLFSVGSSYGGGENMVNAGVTLRVGQGESSNLPSRKAMAQKINDLEATVSQQNAKIEQLTQLVQTLVNKG